MEGIVSAGIDWLTLTAKPKTPEWTVLEGLEKAVMAQAVEYGGEFEAGRLMGYLGDKNDVWFAGVRKDSRILRVSSQMADVVFRSLRSWAPVPHCTRLDIQVTYQLEEDNPRYAATLASMLEEQLAEVHESQRVKRTHINSHGHGDTLNISSRSRPVYMRIYDKHRESKGRYAPGTWRFEVELKQDKPDLVLHDLLQAEWPDLMVARLVRSYMALRGLEVPWSAEYIKVSTKAVMPETTDERRLRWLRETVSASVRELIKRGRYDDVIDALGLTDYGQ